MPDVDRHDRTEVPDDFADLFHILAIENDRVCSTCFSRLARRERFPDEVGYDYATILTFVETVLPEERRWDILDREYYERVGIADRTTYGYPPAGEPTRGGSRACRSCGTFETNRTHPNTRDPPTAEAHADNLSTTLDEYGVEHDPETLRTRVRDYKHDPDMSGNDHAVFSQAILDAVDAALTTDP